MSLMQYPPKPWTDGMKFVHNGTVYFYEASTNSWRFDRLTYARLHPSMQFAVPEEASSFYVEVSDSPLFESVVRAYDSEVEEDRSRMMLFSSEYAQFVPMASSTVSSSQYENLVLLPDLDLSKRYYCRFRWTPEGGDAGPWRPVVLPAGYNEG